MGYLDYRELSRSRLCVIVVTFFALLAAMGTAQANTLENLRAITQASYNLIGLSSLHKQGLTGKDQVIVFIDDGVQLDHPYISQAIIDGFCSSEATCRELYLKSGAMAGVIPAFNQPSPHGLMVGGIIAGRPNTSALGGIAPDAKLISITNTNGNNPGLIAAFEWILQAKKRYNIVAVSGSFGGPNVSARSDIDGCSGAAPELDQRIRALKDAGIIPVFASGNDSNPMRISYPACLPFVISVGAISSSGSLQPYSNTGSALTVLAPSDVMSAGLDGTYFLAGGTSASTPVVAGAVALLKQAQPEATFEQIKKSLQSSTTYLDDLYWKSIPALHLPSALAALKSSTFTSVKIAPAASTDTHQTDLATARAAQTAAETAATQAQESLASALRELNVVSERKAALDTELVRVNAILVSLTQQFEIVQKTVTQLQRENKTLRRTLSTICSTRPKPARC